MAAAGTNAQSASGLRVALIVIDAPFVAIPKAITALGVALCGF
jgi:hypothetical protein